MSDLTINEVHNDLTIEGNDNTLDVSIEQHEINIENSDEITVSPVEVALEFRTDDISLDVVEKSVELLTVGIPGPMGPAGTGGGGTADPIQTIFDQINDDAGYRGDAALGALTSEAKWQVKKIVILGDGTPDDLYADGDDGFVHVWDDRAGLSY